MTTPQHPGPAPDEVAATVAPPSPPSPPAPPQPPEPSGPDGLDVSYENETPEPNPRFVRPVRNGTITALLSMVVLFLFPYGAYLYTDKGRLFTSVMITALIFAIAAMGLNLVAGYTGMLSIGHAAFMGAGALVMVKIGGVLLDPWLTVPFALAWAVVMGVVVAVFCVHLKGFYLTIVTFLSGLVVPTVTLLVLSLVGGQKGDEPRERLAGLYPPVDSEGQPLRQLDLLFHPAESFDKRFYFFTVIMTFVVLAAIAWIVSSGLGRAFRAIKGSDIAARACGIAIYPYRVLSFAMSAFFAGFAGVLISQNPSTSQVTASNFGYNESFKLIFFTIVGGLGTLSGPLIGSIALGFGFTAVFALTGLDQQPGAVGIIFGVMLIVVMVLAPNGAIGVAMDVKRKREKAGLKRGVQPRRQRPPETSEADTLPQPSGNYDPSSGQPILELRGASKVFGGLRAVDTLDMVIMPGTIHALIGPNGSGKTTTINMITGFYRADEGRVFFQGVDVTDEASHKRAHRGMTRTFQNLQVFRDMTCVQNVMVGLQPKMSIMRSFIPGYNRRLEARAYGLLEFVGLTHRAFDPGGSLPYAEQRRLEIARALAGNPDLVLLDEPAAGMNPAETADLTELIRLIRSYGVTVMLIEHHMELVMELSDTITVLDYGGKIAEGPPDLIKNDSRVIEAYLGAEA